MIAHLARSKIHSDSAFNHWVPGSSPGRITSFESIEDAPRKGVLFFFGLPASWLEKSSDWCYKFGVGEFFAVRDIFCDMYGSIQTLSLTLLYTNLKIAKPENAVCFQTGRNR
mgnify:CR=1 FL=1